MIPITLGEIATAVGGRLHNSEGDEMVTSTVEFDSRKITKGGLFLALPGTRVDGHEFAEAAVAAGAVGVLAARPVAAPSVLVGEPDASPEEQSAALLGALSTLAGEVARRLPGLEIVGITGSSGKTSTKDLVAAVLAPLGPTISPPGSFNNELGHPWTVLRADRVTEHLVLELSARGIGHIEALCRVAPPRIGVVLNVGSAHLGEFGSPDSIARAKGELVESLPPTARGGVAVLNADDPRVAAMADRTAARVVTFGRNSASADFRADDIDLDETGRAHFRLITPAGETDIDLRLVGMHQVDNALAAAAVALELGADLEQTADLLSDAEPRSRWRMEVTEREDGVTIINDAYNANPESMRAGLEALTAMTARDGRAWAVLGEMGELGEGSEAAHVEVGRLTARLGVQQLLTVGSAGYQAGYDSVGIGGESMVVPDVAAALEDLNARLRPGDVVLVKASRSVGLERVVEGLLHGDPSRTSPSEDRR